MALSENDSDIQSGDNKKHSASTATPVASSVEKPSMGICRADITKPQVTCNAATDPLSAAQACQGGFRARRRQCRGVIDAHEDSRHGIKRQSADTHSLDEMLKRSERVAAPRRETSAEGKQRVDFDVF